MPVSIAKLLNNIDEELTSIGATAGNSVESLLKASNKAVLSDKPTTQSAIEVIKQLRQVILEQCTFHDIIVQHISQMRHDLNNIDAELDDTVKVKSFEPAIAYDELLSGPGADGAGLSQDEIDDLF